MNRIDIVIGNEELSKACENSLYTLQETLECNQVLEDSVKVCDWQIQSLEEILAKTKEGFEKHVKEAEDKLKEKNSMISHLKEDLGVWESIEPQLTEANELLDSHERAIEMISQEAQEGVISVVKCQECNFSTKTPPK